MKCLENLTLFWNEKEMDEIFNKNLLIFGRISWFEWEELEEIFGTPKSTMKLIEN